MQIFDVTEKGLASKGKEILGGKGWGLASMTEAGMRVPLAVIIPTTESLRYLTGQLPENELDMAVDTILKKFEDLDSPLVSVRSGSRVSMPGMMDTILNVGLDDSTLKHWVGKLGVKCAHDSYKRLIQMYADVVDGVPRETFTKNKSQTLTAYLNLYTKVVGKPFPNARQQLRGAIEAVFKSWNNLRAVEYRKIHNIPDDYGTAVVVQEMVFGNLNDQSCTGVMFTRDPSTGENTIIGEFLVNAQGEDVVAGIRTPQPLKDLQEWNPKIAIELGDVGMKLEAHYKDVQDIEFTVQDGTLYILQTRNAKRTAFAAVRTAVGLHDDGIIDPEDIKKRVTLAQFKQATRPVISPNFTGEPIGTGIAASNGIAVGRAVFSSKDAVESKDPCILIARETTPDDIAGMYAADGILTSTGGSTSHAAVVARGMDKVCVVGVTEMEIHSPHSGGVYAKLGGVKIQQGDIISIEGSTGRVWFGEVPVVFGGCSPHIKRFVDILLEANTALVTNITEVIANSVRVGIATVESGHGPFVVLSMDAEHSPLRDLITGGGVNLVESFGEVRETIKQAIFQPGKPCVVSNGVLEHFGIEYDGPILQEVYSLNDLVKVQGLYISRVVESGLYPLDDGLLDSIIDLKNQAGQHFFPVVLGERTEYPAVNILTEDQFLGAILG